MQSIMINVGGVEAPAATTTRMLAATGRGGRFCNNKIAGWLAAHIYSLTFQNSLRKIAQFSSKVRKPPNMKRKIS